MRRQMVRSVRVDRAGSLWITLAAVHVGEGGAVDHQLRRPLRKRMTNRGLVRNVTLGMAHRPHRMVWSQHERQLAPQHPVCAGDQNAHETVFRPVSQYKG